MGIQSREVKQRHAVYHEAGQMLGRQTVAQPHRQIERLLVVHGFEGSTHAQQYTISDAGTASLRQTARSPCASWQGEVLSKTFFLERKRGSAYVHGVSYTRWNQRGETRMTEQRPFRFS